jgi:hypothetical protein
MIKNIARDFLSNNANFSIESRGRCGAVTGSASDFEFQAFLVAINNEKYSFSSNELKNDPLIVNYVNDSTDI